MIGHAAGLGVVVPEFRRQQEATGWPGGGGSEAVFGVERMAVAWTRTLVTAV